MRRGAPVADDSPSLPTIPVLRPGYGLGEYPPVDSRDFEGGATNRGLVPSRVTLAGVRSRDASAIKAFTATVCGWNGAVTRREKCYPGPERPEPSPNRRGYSSGGVFHQGFFITAGFFSKAA